MKVFPMGLGFATLCSEGPFFPAFRHTLFQHTRGLLKSKLRREKSLWSCPQLSLPTLKNTPDRKDTNVPLGVTKL